VKILATLNQDSLFDLKIHKKKKTIDLVYTLNSYLNNTFHFVSVMNFDLKRKKIDF